MLEDIIADDLEVLFVGFNPSPRSAESGHHYAGRNNQFWRLLAEAGLTPRQLTPGEDGLLPTWRLGSTNLVSRATRGAEDLTTAELGSGVPRLAGIVERVQPGFVAYTGKGVYLAASRKRTAPWGLQEERLFGAVRDVVLPSPSGRVRMTFDEKLSHYRELDVLRRGARGGG